MTLDADDASPCAATPGPLRHAALGLFTTCRRWRGGAGCFCSRVLSVSHSQSGLRSYTHDFSKLICIEGMLNTGLNLPGHMAMHVNAICLPGHACQRHLQCPELRLYSASLFGALKLEAGTITCQCLQAVRLRGAQHMCWSQGAYRAVPAYNPAHHIWACAWHRVCKHSWIVYAVLAVAWQLADPAPKLARH